MFRIGSSNRIYEIFLNYQNLIIAMRRLWSYSELKYVVVHSKKNTVDEVARQINDRFHDGMDVRTSDDVQEAMKNSSNFFNK